MNLCECGCGEPVAGRFVHGHNRRIPGPPFVEDPQTHCWVWRRGRTGNGYGVVPHNGRHTTASRVYYEELVGPIPEGLQIDHLCRNRACVNPGHLEPVTPRENVVRGDSPALSVARGAARTHCKHGHPFDAANTHHLPGGGRACRTCRREQQRRRRAAA